MLRSSSGKHLAQELAQQICRQGAAEFARLFGFTGLVAGAAAQAGAAGNNADPNRIGIWRRPEGSNEFIRDIQHSADWPYWAQLASFALKGTTQRVLLLGESAARGMFYDPGLTPAQVLASLLAGDAGEHEAVEVLDLARTNANMGTVLEVAQASLQLGPAGVVIFAGNNWLSNRSYLEQTGRFYELADTVRYGGARALREQLEHSLATQIIALVQQVGAMYAASGTPVYWIIPEFNLLDWRDPAITCHWLENPDANRQWCELRRIAESQLHDRQYHRCLETAQAMCALDQGNCSTSLYLLADSYGGLGERQLQRQALERARDAAIVDSTRFYSPRISTLVRDTLRREVAASGQNYIDLQELFADHLQGQLPGRRMFLDYCHLTSEAIGVTMSEVARRLLSEVFGRQDRVQPLSGGVLPVSREVEADALLMAAIHNAHWGQSLDVVTHYCMRAVEKSPALLDLMRAFVDIQHRRTPTWMNAKAGELLDGMSAQVKRYLFSMEFKCLDRLLFQAFEACCRRHAVDLAGQLAAIRQQQHSVSALGKVDLLDPYYHSTSFSNQQLIEGPVEQRHNFYQAYDQVSEFCFIANSQGDLSGCVTLRVSPWVEPQAEVEIRLNATRLIALQARQEWMSWRFEVPRALLADGINEVRISWPALAAGCAAPLEQICIDIQRQRIPQLYPTYGDIYLLTLEPRQGGSAQQR